MKNEIADINQQIRKIKYEIKKHERILEDWNKLRGITAKEVANCDYYMAVNPDLKKPIHLSGGVVLKTVRDFCQYYDWITTQVELSDESLHLIKEDLRLMENDLRQKEHLLARFESELIGTQGIFHIEGYWTFIKPKNNSLINVLYEKKSKKLIGKWAFIDRIDYVWKGATAFILNVPNPETPDVYSGTEYSYDKNRKKLITWLTVTVKGTTMIYRIKH